MPDRGAGLPRVDGRNQYRRPITSMHLFSGIRIDNKGVQFDVAALPGYLDPNLQAIELERRN